jgi:hypothetical protein
MIRTMTLLVLMLTISSTSQVLSQTNRYTKLSYSKPDYPVQDNSALLQLLEARLARQKENMMEQCYQAWIDIYQDKVKGDTKCLETIYPHSSWIKSLTYINPEGDGLNLLIMKTISGERYTYFLGESIWQLWKSAPSKGDFFHEHIRPENSPGVLPLEIICEIDVTRQLGN